MAKRIVYFDLLTIVACLAVVFLHCNGIVHSFQPTPRWDQALAVEVLAYWAVPIFFMLTGANNMGYRAKYSTKDFLLRRMKKLIVPFVFWSAALYVLSAVTNPEATLSIKGFLSGFMAGTIEPIYWFFPAIISLTLAMPVITMLKPHRKLMWYVVGVSFTLAFLLPPLCRLANVPWTGAYELPVAGGYVTYAIFGYLLATTDVPKKYRYGIYLAAVACFALRYGYTYVMSYATGTTNRLLFDYNSFVAFFPAAAVFLLFKHLKMPKILQENSRIVSQISGCCFGIYLIHKPILDYVVLGALGLDFASGYVRLICPFVIFLSALAIVFILKKIPLAKEIVP